MTKLEKSLNITVGISAYNEEANIKQLIETVLTQSERNFKLEAVYVISGGSTDRTVAIAKSICDNRVHVIENKKRRGQVYAQNMIFARATSDVVIILEADTCPVSRDYLALMIDPILRDSGVGLVQGNAVPLLGDSFVGRVIKAQIDAYRETISLFYKSRQHGLRVSGRGGRAFTKTVYEKLVWPQSVPEDSYAFLWCRSHGIATKFQERALCQFKGPQTVSDLIFERMKTAAGVKALKKYFIADELRRPLGSNMVMSAVFIIRHPLYAMLYVAIKLNIIVNHHDIPFTDFWPVVASTKKLNHEYYE